MSEENGVKSEDGAEENNGKERHEDESEHEDLVTEGFEKEQKYAENDDEWDENVEEIEEELEVESKDEAEEDEAELDHDMGQVAEQEKEENGMESEDEDENDNAERVAMIQNDEDTGVVGERMEEAQMQPDPLDIFCQKENIDLMLSLDDFLKRKESSQKKLLKDAKRGYVLLISCTWLCNMFFEFVHGS